MIEASVERLTKFLAAHRNTSLGNVIAIIHRGMNGPLTLTQADLGLVLGERVETKAALELLEARLGPLARAIQDRDWEQVEFEYRLVDREIRQMRGK